MMTATTHKGQTAYTLTGRHFTVGGTAFEVVASWTTGSGVIDAEHRIRGPGGTKVMTHKQLIDIHLKQKT